ncbi:PhzF family phenazine biosynthesis protein [Saliphagus infecundisoli]|uniref:PhzF family phenazine biosynthesis protein n=1 Tax=Saliphagus infecundisoli TaxID=1849069 RepID=A0ABD5QCJ1_9EURY|nr:PhzF family phenazine biosynthesis protein [Saliphagus infecundisoli]
MTDDLEVALVDAFTDDPLTGNAAGVVPDAGELSEPTMQAIARELSVSETAFLSASAEAERRIRYFTPTQEVDLCGHATIASGSYLHETGDVETGTTTLETNVGVIEVDVEDDGTVWMSQDDPEIREADASYGTVADALGVERAALEGAREDLPLAVSSTGLPFLMVPITYLSDLGDADPDMAAIEPLADSVGATGIYAFTFDTLQPESALHGRMFAPGAGVPEDPVTGTASCAVAAYLEAYDAFDPTPEELRLEQGHYVSRPGTVLVRIDDEVRIGGRAVTALEGMVRAPERGDDGILEA